MHSSWSILGIAPTSDLIAIKRAYASQLKRNRPDDNPDGYQKLRQAYDWAQQHAHWQIPVTPNFAEQTEEETHYSVKSESTTTRSSEVFKPPLQTPPEAPAAPSSLNTQDTPIIFEADFAEAPPTRETEKEQSPEQINPNIFEADHPENSRERGESIDDRTEAKPLSPQALIDAVRAYYRQYGKNSLAFYWPELKEALERTPFHMRDQTNVSFVDLVLTENLPPEFIDELARYFSWGQDFRLEKILGIDKALRLSDFLDNVIISPNRRKQFLAQYASLDTYHRLHQAGSWFKMWLFALLNPIELFDQTGNHKPEYYALGFDVYKHDEFHQKAKTAFTIVFSLPILLLGALHQKNALWSLPWPGNSFGYILAAFFSIFLLVIIPISMLQQVYRLFQKSRMEKWLIQHKPGKWLNGVAFSYFLILSCLSAFFPAVPIQISDASPFAWMQTLLTVVFIVLLWPHKLSWEPVFLFLGLGLGISTEASFDHHGGAWTAFFLISAWLTATQWLLFKTYLAISRIDKLPWRVLFPKSRGGWILYLIGFQGVVAVMGVVLFISAPFSLLAYAIRYGWNKAYLALCAASVIAISGILPFTVFVFCLSLQFCVLAFILIEKFSKRLTQLRFFQIVGNR